MGFVKLTNQLIVITFSVCLPFNLTTIYVSVNSLVRILNLISDYVVYFVLNNRVLSSKHYLFLQTSFLKSTIKRIAKFVKEHE